MKTKILISIFFISVLAAPAALLAQDLVKQGTVEAGGSIMFSSQSAESGSGLSSSASYNTFALDPFIGFVFKGGFELGVQAEFLEQSHDNESQSLFGLFISPGINIGIGDNSYPFVSALFGYSHVDYGNQAHNEQEGFGIGVNGGLKICMKNSFMLLFQLQYLSQTYDRTDYYPDVTLNTLSAGIGFRVYFLKKEKKK